MLLFDSFDVSLEVEVQFLSRVSKPDQRVDGRASVLILFNLRVIVKKI